MSGIARAVASYLKGPSMPRPLHSSDVLLRTVVVIILSVVTLHVDAYAQETTDFRRRTVEAEGNYFYQGTRGAEPGETPLPDIFVTRSAYVDRSVEFNYAGFSHVDGQRVDRSDFSLGVNYALNNRFALRLEAPYVFRNPQVDPNTSGFGDLEVGVQYILYGYVAKSPESRSYGSGSVSGASQGFTRRTIEGESGGSSAVYGASGAAAPPLVLSVGMDVAAPTGSPSRQLGEGFASLAPQALFYWRVNEVGSALRGQFGLEVPTVSGEPTGFFYNLAFSQIFLGTQDWRRFNTVVGVLELNGLGGESDRVYVTPGVRWYLTQFDLIGVAGSFPITGARDFDSQILVSYIHELPERSRARRR